MRKHWQEVIFVGVGVFLLAMMFDFAPKLQEANAQSPIYGIPWDGPSALRVLPTGSSLYLGTSNATVDPSGNIVTTGSVTVSGGSIGSAGVSGAVTVQDGVFGSNMAFAVAVCESGGGATDIHGAASTSTGKNCLPAGSVIDAVVYRVTVTITTATSFTIGITGTASKFCATQSTLTVGTTGVCYAQTGSAGAIQAAAAPVLVTPSTTPGAGKIRLLVYYHTWTAPTS